MQIAGTFSGMMGQVSIPEFFVYGEPSRSLEVGFFHVETVRARNNMHLGVVQPHKHAEMAQITFWTSGRGRYQIEDQIWDFSAPCVCFVPSSIVHGFTIEPEADAIVVSIADDVFKSIGQQAGLSLEAPTFVRASVDDAAWQRLGAIMHLVAAEYGDSAQWHAMHSLIAAALSYVARLGEQGSAVASSPALTLAMAYRKAVDINFRQAWTIDHYVADLATTPYLLDKAVRTILGQSPKDVILERRFVEAKRLLLFTIRSVEDIGFEVGFSEPAYFSRFFRKRCGQAPMAWRRNNARALAG